MENYKKLKAFLKKTNPRCSNELFEDLFHELLIRNLNVEIENENTYYYTGFRFLLLNANTTSKNRIKVATKYYEKLDNEFLLVPRDNNLFVKIVNEVERLPGKTKERVKEYLFGQMTISEIAKENNLNYDTTKATIKRGLDILKERLQNER